MFRGLMARNRGFTLVELLVVIGIIALLVGILLPALTRARSQANATACKAQLQQISIGLFNYTVNNNGYIVPSYNLPFVPGQLPPADNYTGGPTQPLDGWAPILDRDGYVKGNPERSARSVFYCPDTVDIEGVKDGQTGSDPGKPRGWTDWPLQFTAVGGDSSPKVGVTIPSAGFNKIIRVSYWINAYNPVGSKPDVTADLFYTCSVGLGRDATTGEYLRLHKTSGIRYSSKFIVVADGVYMGRQGDSGLANGRIGFRHRSSAGKKDAMANVGFADGHVESIDQTQFPLALKNGTADAAYATKKSMNARYSIYANPDKAFSLP
jgi:prepilin-type N-terminal cleavage/methylation domain-containing protein/prepilin-type processing-associated H-X9-DG protein